MKQQLQLNVIPFTPPVQEAVFAFYTKREYGFCRIHKDDLNDLTEGVIDENQLDQGQWLYTDFQPPKKDAILFSVNLKECIHFASHYYRHLIRNHFKDVADIMHSNFTSEIEVWILNTKSNSPKFKVYNQFTLKVQHGRVTDGPELVLSYDGTTKVLTKSISEIYNFNTNLFNWIVCNGVIYKWKYRPADVINQPANCFPVLSNTLKPHFEIAFDVPVLQNRYPKYLNILTDFYNEFLCNDVFRNIIPLSEEGFYKPAEDQLKVISSTSNDLLYSNNQTGKEPKKDFKYKGPYQLPTKPSNFKFFFIYQTSDKAGAVTELYRYLNNGYKDEKFPFPKMQDYIKIPFELDITMNIEFENIQNAVDTVRNAVKNADWLPDTRYMALFINPVPKSDIDVGRNSVYYQIKEILLYEEVLSQVIKSEHLFKNGLPNKYFNTFLPHIEIAILAKLGGVPWRLNRQINNELIVGVGAHYSVARKINFVGSAFCFNNEGIFKGFDCFQKNDTTKLAGSIREAVQNFIKSNETASRLIIHFFKDISKKELEPILNTLHSLGLNIPVIIISINKTESKELLGFDVMDRENLMPYSGTILKVGKSEYLLFNNTRYEKNSKPAQKEYHFPVKIALSSTVEGMLDDINLVTQLIDQIYQFSRMYWKSTNQQSLPVTIKYPEMVAEIYPHFKEDKLPAFGKENLWFL
jgi:hypothetical protein